MPCISGKMIIKFSADSCPYRSAGEVQARLYKHVCHLGWTSCTYLILSGPCRSDQSGVKASCPTFILIFISSSFAFEILPPLQLSFQPTLTPRLLANRGSLLALQPQLKIVPTTTTALTRQPQLKIVPRIRFGPTPAFLCDSLIILNCS